MDMQYTFSGTRIMADHAIDGRTIRGEDGVYTTNVESADEAETTSARGGCVHIDGFGNLTARRYEGTGPRCRDV